MEKTVGFYLYPNTSATSESARNLIRIIPTGVATDADIVEDVSREMPVTEARYRMIVQEVTRIMLERVRRGEKVDIGPLRFELHDPDAKAYEDSAFDPEVNCLKVKVTILGELAKATEGLVPKKISAAVAAGLVQFSNEMDVTTEAFGEIRGTDEFVLLGNGLTLDGDDEYVRILDAKSEEELARATVYRVSKGQRGYAKLPSALPKGKAILEIGTHGLLDDEALHVFRKPVTILAGAEPVDPTAPRILNVRDGSDESLIDTVHEGGGVISEGVNLGGVTAYRMRYVKKSGETATVEYDLEECSKSAARVGVPPVIAWNDVEDLDKSKGATTIVVTPKGTAERKFKIV